MRGIRILVWFGFGLVTMSVVAQFTLNLSPVSPGAAELTFTREPGYYYCLETSPDLTGTFTQASAWIAGDGLATTWPLTYPTSPATGGGGQVASNLTFSLYPFEDGKTLVTWKDASDTRYSAIITQNYTALPPTVIVPENAPAPSLFLLIGRIAWDAAYDALQPALLPAAQQGVLTQFTTRHADILAATAGSPGPGVVAETEKQFYRIRRVEADADGDGLDWAMETFQFGTDPDDSDTDDDALDDAQEIADGTDPFNPFNGQLPIVTTYGGTGQIGWTNAFLSDPISVRIRNSDHVPAYRWPVQVIVGHGQISLANDGTGMLGSTPIIFTDSEGFVHFYVMHGSDYNMDCHVSVGIDDGISQQWINYTSRILGNPNGVAAPQQMAGEWNADRQFVVSWEDASSDETEFVIERSIGDESNFLPLARVPANVVEWTDLPPPTAPIIYYRANSTH